MSENQDGPTEAIPQDSRAHFPKTKYKPEVLSVMETLQNAVPDPKSREAAARAVVAERRLGDRKTAREEERTAEQARYATTDLLTGLRNRKYLVDELPGLLRVSQSAGTAFSVLFIDMDRFKPINDNLGHEVGDKVLIEFANQLKKVFSRSSDSIVRVGGDEFVVLLPNTPLEKETKKGEKEGGALGLANELLTNLHDEQLSFLKRTGLDVLPSCSIGVVQDTGQTPDVLLREADAAMYQAKRAGRGNAVVWNREIQDNPERQMPIFPPNGLNPQV